MRFGAVRSFLSVLAFHLILLSQPAFCEEDDPIYYEVDAAAYLNMPDGGHQELPVVILIETSPNVEVKRITDGQGVGHLQVVVQPNGDFNTYLMVRVLLQPAEAPYSFSEQGGIPERQYFCRNRGDLSSRVDIQLLHDNPVRTSQEEPTSYRWTEAIQPLTIGLDALPADGSLDTITYDWNEDILGSHFCVGGVGDADRSKTVERNLEEQGDALFYLQQGVFDLTDLGELYDGQQDILFWGKLRLERTDIRKDAVEDLVMENFGEYINASPHFDRLIWEEHWSDQ